jgi:hypothetical protein
VLCESWGRTDRSADAPKQGDAGLVMGSSTAVRHDGATLAGEIPGKRCYNYPGALVSVPGLDTQALALTANCQKQGRHSYYRPGRRGVTTILPQLTLPSLCITSCWPPMRERSPCSSIHPITPAHILGLTGGTLKKRTAKISHCRLYFARRWDLKRQILSFLGPTPPPCFRYGPPQSISRPGWCCPVVGPTSRMCCMAGCGWFATVCASIVCQFPTSHVVN